jgi:hypothetical protein
MHRPQSASPAVSQSPSTGRRWSQHAAGERATQRSPLTELPTSRHSAAGQPFRSVRRVTLVAEGLRARGGSFPFVSWP